MWLRLPTALFGNVATGAFLFWIELSRSVHVVDVILLTPFLSWKCLIFDLHELPMFRTLSGCSVLPAHNSLLDLSSFLSKCSNYQRAFTTVGWVLINRERVLFKRRYCDYSSGLNILAEGVRSYWNGFSLITFHPLS